MGTQTISSIQDYIDALPDNVQAIAEAIRQTIHEAAPGCVEQIRYGMPAFQIGGRTVIYFALWKQHIGLYPIYRGSAALEAEIAPYRAKKDTVRLPLSKPIPPGLVTKIVHAQLSGAPQR